MDNILKALNNISDGIEELVRYSKEKNKNNSDSSDGKIFQNKDFTKFFESIKDGIKSIKKDTEKILKNQEGLKQISKDKTKSTLFEKIGENTKKIKDGASTIVLIAAGILAIGLAFKIIGQVDFASVIALSISLPLVAMAFVKISEMKGIKISEMKNLFLVIVTMSTSLMVASWIMSLIHPISLTQGITAIFIAGTFAALSFSIEKIAMGIRNITANDLIMMPLVLFTMSLSITLSSQFLRGIHPISISQGITAILIAGTFAILGYGIGSMVKNFKNIKPEDIIDLPFVLVTLSIAIVASAAILHAIWPITLKQGLAAIGVALVLTAMSLSLPILALAVKSTSLKDVFLMTLILPLLSTAVWLSSIPLSKTIIISDTLNLTLQTIAIAIMSVAIGGAIWAINAMGLSTVDILKGGLAIVAIATTIMLSSWILSVGKYDKFPTLEWAAGVGVSLVAFGLSAIVLGAIASSGVGAVALLAGAVAVLALSGVIVATSYILAAGNYGTYPTLAWSSGVALSLTAFGAGALLLGTMILGTFGLGALALTAGAAGVLIIAQSIVDASDILRKGTYTGGPTKEWSEGISLALGAFSPIFKTIFDRGLLSIFSSGPSADDFADAITTVSNGIVTAGKFFASVPDIWKGGPTSEWAAGVGGALGAFTPVFDALSKSSGLFGSGPTPADMSKAILNIANSIVDVGNLFANANGVWTKAPTPEWANGVSNAISAFGPIFDWFSKNKDNGWFDNSFDDVNQGILKIAQSIIDVDKILGKGSFTNAIPAGYVQSMSENIKEYVDLISYLQSKNVGAFSFIDALNVTYGLSQISNGYEKLSNTIRLLGNSINALDMEKLNSLKSFTGNIVLLSLMDSEQFEKMMTAFENKGGIFVKLMQELEEKTDKQQRYGTIGSVRNTSGTTNNTDTQILSALQTIAKNTGETARHTKSFSELMEELRHNNNNSLKDKKHYQ